MTTNGCFHHVSFVISFLYGFSEGFGLGVFHFFIFNGLDDDNVW